MKKRVILTIILILNLSVYSYGQKEIESYVLDSRSIYTDTLIEQLIHRDTVGTVVHVIARHPVYPSQKIQYFFPDTVYHVLKIVTQPIVDDDYENRQFTLKLSRIDEDIYKLALFTYDRPKGTVSPKRFVSNRIYVVNNQEIEIYTADDYRFAFERGASLQYYVFTMIFTWEPKHDGTRGGEILDIYY
jgi:hypothetical protein